MSITESLDRAASLIDQAGSLVITAGAGMGVDSGLPDFRGDEGFWRAYPALGKAGLGFSEIACPDTFRTDPSLAWGFYGHRLALYRETMPHRGFALLKHWAGLMEHGHTIYTSNVDGQFQKAGFSDETINECHGSIHHLQCLAACGDDIWSATDFVPLIDEANCRLLSQPPVCCNCRGLARPNILMFGDSGWSHRRQEQQEFRQDHWLTQAWRPVVIELGAGTAIPSVRYFGQRITSQYGGRLIRINPRESDVRDPRDVGVPMGALEGLEAIAGLLGGGWRLPDDSVTR